MRPHGNLVLSKWKKGRRMCLTCQRARIQRWNAGRPRSGGRWPNGRSATTRCPHGHEYTPENTYVSATGHRKCRECNRDTFRRWYARHRKD